MFERVRPETVAREVKHARLCSGAEDSLLLVIIDHPCSIVDRAGVGHVHKPKEVGIRIFVTARFGCDVMEVHEAELDRRIDTHPGLFQHLATQRLLGCLASLAAPSGEDMPLIPVAHGQYLLTPTYD